MTQNKPKPTDGKEIKECERHQFTEVGGNCVVCGKSSITTTMKSLSKKKTKPDIITQMFESMGVKVVDVTPKVKKKDYHPEEDSDKDTPIGVDYVQVGELQKGITSKTTWASTEPKVRLNTTNSSKNGNVTTKTDWEKELKAKFGCYPECGCDLLPCIERKELVDFIRSLLSHQREEIYDQVEKEVEFVSVDLVDEYDDYGKGWHDACLEYDLKLMKLDKKLSTLRKEER